jgi:hypothetical protein
VTAIAHTSARIAVQVVSMTGMTETTSDMMNVSGDVTIVIITIRGTRGNEEATREKGKEVRQYLALLLVYADL